MTTQSTQIAVLFADVSGSSALYDQVGDEKAEELVSVCIMQMSMQVTVQGGTVVKTIGDEVMSHFPSADQACKAAGCIQHLGSNDDHALSVRIGASYGIGLFKDDDVYGKVVNEAAAVAEIARARQTIVTQAFCDNLTKSRELSIIPFDRITLKGSHELSVIYRVCHVSDSVSDFATEHVNTDFDFSSLQDNALHLEHGRTSLDISSRTDPFVIGRDEKTCDLGIASNLASRDHCHIFYSHGKYVLKDHSTNGTFIQLQDGEAIYLRREELPLQGCGKISLGQKIGSNAETLIYFRCN